MLSDFVLYPGFITLVTKSHANLSISVSFLFTFLTSLVANVGGRQPRDGEYGPRPSRQAVL
jgi:hypothetical protein